MLMELDILRTKDRYISATEASAKTGYSTDYIGQLSRAGKIHGKLVDRTWYVDLNILLEHKRTRRLGRRKKAKEESPDHMALGRKKLPNESFFQKTSFAYEEDLRPNFPTLSKKKKAKILSVFKEAALTSLLLIVIVSAGVSSLQEVSPKFEKKLENITTNLGNNLQFREGNSLDSIYLSGSIKAQIIDKVGEKSLQRIREEYQKTLEEVKEEYFK